jgi:hypothetical protein
MLGAACDDRGPSSAVTRGIATTLPAISGPCSELRGTSRVILRRLLGGTLPPATDHL